MKASRKLTVKEASSNVVASAKSGGDESLGEIERKLERQLHIEERAHRLRRDNEEWELRRKAAKGLLWLFLIANGVSLIALFVAWMTDYSNMTLDKNYFDHRIFDKDVLMALLAATTVQLGAAALIISKWLFPPH